MERALKDPGNKFLLIKYAAINEKAVIPISMVFCISRINEPLFSPY
jgi:hypothetical protein